MRNPCSSCIRIIAVVIPAMCMLTLATVASAMQTGKSNSETVRPVASPGEKPDGSRRLILERFETPSSVFEIGVAPCKKQVGCPYEIRWHSAGKSITITPLYVPAPSQEISGARSEEEPWGWRAGRNVWYAGEENSYVATAAQVVRLDASTVGLLVWQEFGFEHVHRAHRLIVPKDGKLVVAWSHTELAGPVWTAAYMTSAGELIFIYNVANSSYSEDADTLRVIRYVYSRTQGKMVATTPSRVVAVALTVGDFADVQAAVRYRSPTTNKCMQDNYYSALSSDSLRSVANGRITLARVFASRLDAEKDRQRLIQCGVTLKQAIVDVWSSSEL